MLPVTAPNVTDVRPRLGDRDDVADYLSRDRVFLDGHFELLSGMHSPNFIAFSALARDEYVLAEIADTLAERTSTWAPDAVVAPSTVGVSLGSALAVRAGAPLYLASLDEESRADGIVGSPDLAGKRVLLVNDVVTTGRGLHQLAEVVATAGAELAGAAWFVSRAQVDLVELLGTENLACLAELELAAYDGAHCPLCSAGDEPELAIDLN